MTYGKEKKRILILENQWIEFKKIKEGLKSNSDEFDVVLPEAEVDDSRNFKILASWIRIWVDNKYPETDYRDIALGNIASLAKKADLIIMDHILGGSYSCLTGIDLAKKLPSLLGESPVPPILFLSKTEHNDRKRCDEYDEYLLEPRLPPTDWIHKGHFGDEILQSDYVKKYVVIGIEKLLSDKKNDNKLSVQEPKPRKPA
jgi:CheY-like chemotaxis protein